MLLSRVLFSAWVSPPISHGFLAGRIISKLSKQKACSVSNEQVMETAHPVRGERLQRQQMRWRTDQGAAKGSGWGGGRTSGIRAGL